MIQNNKNFKSDESDMKILSTDGSFLQNIFAANPLLGNYILHEDELEIFHGKAKNAINHIADNYETILSKEEKMSVALSVINYAKHWDTEDVFRDYILKQYGYRFNQRIYDGIMNSTLEALEENGRWIFSRKGRHYYKSTVMIHAMGSIRSWMYLCDFLSDFYQNNLGCHYLEKDPYVLNMVIFLRNIFYDSEIKSYNNRDIEIKVGTKPYCFQEGIRKLIVYKPNYAAKVFDRMLKRIHSYMNSNVVQAKKYEDELVDLWFKKKKEYYLKYKRNFDSVEESVHHRVAFDYDQIRLDYKFLDNNIQIEVPDIRLAECSSQICYFEVYYKEELIDRRTLKCYGNELGRTISGFTYSLNDYLSIDEDTEISPRIVIKYGKQIIYDSVHKLRRKMIVFCGEKEKNVSEIMIGNYVVMVPKDVEISGTCIETSIIKTVGGFKYLFVELKDNYSLVVDNIIVSFDHDKNDKIRVNIPEYENKIIYVENGLEYRVCKENSEISIAVDKNDKIEKYMILLNGNKVSFSDLKFDSADGLDVYTISLKELNNDKNYIRIVDFSCDKIVVDKYFIIIPDFSFSFDSRFYFTKDEIRNCCLKYVIKGEEYEVNNVGVDYRIFVEYKSGVIEFEIPIIRLLDLEEKNWKKSNYFINEIDRGFYLKLYSMQDIECKIFIGSTEVKRDAMGLFPLGNIAHSFMDLNTKDIRFVIMHHEEKIKDYNIGVLYFKEQFLSVPKLECIEEKLMWDCGDGFIGDKSKETYIRIYDEFDQIMLNKKIDLDATIILEYIYFDEGEYKYCIYRESKELFSLEEEKLAQGKFVFGSYDKIRFKNKKIVINQIMFNNVLDTGSIDILKSYIDNIVYDEELSKKEGSEGVCPTYFGTMYYIGSNKKRYNYASENKYKKDELIRLKTNPVKIVYINDSILLVTDSDDDALMYKFYYDKRLRENVYYITDYNQKASKNSNYNSVDLLRYKKEDL